MTACSLVALSEVAATAGTVALAEGVHGGALIVPSRDQGQASAPSKVSWPVWQLNLRFGGKMLDIWNNIRTTLLNQSGSTGSRPLALVFIKDWRHERFVPSERLVDTVVVIYGGAGRRQSAMERTFIGLLRKLQPERRSCRELVTPKPIPLSFQGLSDYLASLPVDNWSCESYLPDVGNDAECLKAYVQLVSATP